MTAQNMAMESSPLMGMPAYSEKHQAMDDELNGDIALIRAESEDTGS